MAAKGRLRNYANKVKERALMFVIAMNVCEGGIRKLIEKGQLAARPASIVQFEARSIYTQFLSHCEDRRNTDTASDEHMMRSHGN